MAQVDLGTQPSRRKRCFRCHLWGLRLKGDPHLKPMYRLGCVWDPRASGTGM